MNPAFKEIGPICAETEYKKELNGEKNETKRVEKWQNLVWLFGVGDEEGGVVLGVRTQHC